MVTHDPHAAERAQRTLHLEKGVLVAGAVDRMKFLPLVWRNLLRRKVRTIFTIGLDRRGVRAVRRPDGDPRGLRDGRGCRGRRSPDDDPQDLAHPAAAASYDERIQATEGVDDGDPRQLVRRLSTRSRRTSFANMAVDPESWLQMYPEFELPADQKKAWLADRTGAIVGADLRERFGWKVGDRIPLQARFIARHDGRLGVHRSTASTTRRAGRRQDAVLLPLRNYLNEALRQTRAAPTRSGGT